MKEKIVYFLKQNKFIYGAYYYIMNLFLRSYRLFLKTDDKLILFVSFGGRYFNESPKALYDAMLKDTRFKEYKLVWAFRDPSKYPNVKDRITIDSLCFYRVALKARCWITNVAIERGLKFKSPHTFYFNTTHTTLPKLCGFDAYIPGSDVFKAFGRSSFDCTCACSEYEAERQPSMFHIKKEQVLLSGYPKNDCLNNYSETDIKKIKKELAVPEDKTVILYAPTYRENSGTSMGLDIDIKKWRRILGEKYIVLFRAHPTMMSSVNIEGIEDFVKDVSEYPYNTDLMIISDILVSDYSGIFFEFAVLERPMYCYAFDYYDYIKKRPLYFDIRKELPGGLLNEEDLLKLITSHSIESIIQVKAFREKYVTVYGHATEICLNKIYSNIIKNA